MLKSGKRVVTLPALPAHSIQGNGSVLHLQSGELVGLVFELHSPEYLSHLGVHSGRHLPYYGTSKCKGYR